MTWTIRGTTGLCWTMGISDDLDLRSEIVGGFEMACAAATCEFLVVACLAWFGCWHRRRAVCPRAFVGFERRVQMMRLFLWL